jgi:hypothetical protein
MDTESIPLQFNSKRWEKIPVDDFFLNGQLTKMQMPLWTTNIESRELFKKIAVKEFFFNGLYRI